MLPVTDPRASVVGFNSVYKAAVRLSGVFYDFFKLDEQHVGFYISDVCGHGVPAAMLTVYLKQCVEARKAFDRNSDFISFPSVVMRSLFDSFNQTNFKDETYIIMLYAIYNLETRRLIYCSAGMNTAPIIIKQNGRIQEITIKGIPICKIEEIIDVEYTDMFIDIEKGDKMLFYTDGLIDAENVEKKKYSEERLMRLLGDNYTDNADILMTKLTEDFERYITGRKIIDDVTYFMIEF
jgi:sigma-B regulation protein RsbU (phosphoserine phosphatase)